MLHNELGNSRFINVINVVYRKCCWNFFVENYKMYLLATDTAVPLHSNDMDAGMHGYCELFLNHSQNLENVEVAI